MPHGTQKQIEDFWNSIHLCEHFSSSLSPMVKPSGRAKTHTTVKGGIRAMFPAKEPGRGRGILGMKELKQNSLVNAKNQFRQLYMKSGDKFHDFLSEFLYLAAEAGTAEDSWKDELYHRITTELQKMTMNEKLRDGTFKGFSDYCSQTASHL